MKNGENMARNFALITGASSGIGLEIARVFAENGYDILINSSGERLEQAAAQLKSLGVEVTAVQSDYLLTTALKNSGAQCNRPDVLSTPLPSTLESVPMAISPAKVISMKNSRLSLSMSPQQFTSHNEF